MIRTQDNAHAISSTGSPWIALILFAFMSLTLVSIVVLGIVGEDAFTNRTSHAEGAPAAKATAPTSGNANLSSLLPNGTEP